MTKEWPTVILEKVGNTGVARVILNRANKRNALDKQLFEDLLSALQEVHDDPHIRVVITKGNGPSYCAGLDVFYLRSLQLEGPRDWDRPSLPNRLFEAVRNLPKITIAQVSGYCLGGGLALLNSHDLAVAATNAQIGMPEILRGGFGAMATSTLFHAGVPLKKAAMIQLTGRNLSGVEAERLGLVSMAVEAAELESTTLELAKEIAMRPPATLAHAKITVQMGRDLSLPQAMQLDELVGDRLRSMMDPTANIDKYLASQAGGTNIRYRRPDA